jgi:NAD(P)-dependent dehydrogenase (short-subunit alcohol dehydrogenase family)
LEEIVAAIRSSGGKAHGFVCDITRSQEVESLREKVSRLGRVTLLVNNAGVAPSAKLEATTDEMWDQTISVNLTATFYMSRAFVPAMRLVEGSRIINIASTAAFEGFAYTAAYTASKHGILGLTRALAKELERSGIRVNAVCPGFVRTKIVEESVERLMGVAGKSQVEAEQQLASMNKEGRILEPGEIAETVYRLTQENSIPSGKAIDSHGMLLD